MNNSNRRNFIKNTITLSLGAAVLPALGPLNVLAADPQEKGRQDNPAAFQFVQDKLPYAFSALEPHIDAATMEIHYTKHHATYIKNVNEAIVAEKLNYASDIDFFANASKLSVKARNNGGGSWNHNFFWHSLQAGGPGAPAGALKAGIDETFGSLDKFKELFAQAAIGRFGSGWAWLISDKGTLKIISTPNQDNPLMDDAPVKGKPLLALDVWEHAYYLKYQNKRNEYITAWWNLVNWNEVAKRL